MSREPTHVGVPEPPQVTSWKSRENAIKTQLQSLPSTEMAAGTGAQLPSLAGAELAQPPDDTAGSQAAKFGVTIHRLPRDSPQGTGRAGVLALWSGVNLLRSSGA